MQNLLFQTNPFAGKTYEAKHDEKRLTSQLERVREALLTGGRYTLEELKAKCGGSEAGVSARIRDLRKTQFGGYDVQSGRRGDPKRGLWEYWIKNEHTD